MAEAEPESLKRKQGEISASAGAADGDVAAKPGLPPDADTAEAEPESKKRRQEGASDSAEAADGGADARPELRFPVGERVLCNMSKRSNGFLWRRGTVFAHWQNTNGEAVPYVVTLDESGGMAGAMEDDDECIRLAARATLDTRIMRAFALPAESRAGADLRFLEGDRVAVQLDAGIWEEGAVTERWAVPQRNGKVLKAWTGLAVPYAVQLDIGGDVMVPLDTDEAIRAESAKRPPQKSIAEQIGGKARAPAAPGKRFVKRRNPAGQWVQVDTTTGGERPCDPPDSDVDM